MKRQKRDLNHTPFARLASVVASAILVLNLLPLQGIAEARDEIANFVIQTQEQSESQGNSANGAAEADQGQSYEAEPPALQDANASSNDTDISEGGEQSSDTGEAKSADDGKSNQEKENASGASEGTQSTESDKSAESTQSATSGDVQTPQPTEVSQETIPSKIDLAEYLTEATIEGASVLDGVTNVTEGKDYEVSFVFTERADLQFADSEELIFALPAEFIATGEQKALTDPVVVRYMDEGGNKQEFTLGKNVWRIDENNVLHFAWCQTSDTVQDGQAKNNEPSFTRLTTLANATFELRVRGAFAPEAKSVNFGCGPIELKVSVKPDKKDEDALAKKDSDKPSEKPTEQSAEQPIDNPIATDEAKPAEQPTEKDEPAANTKHAQTPEADQPKQDEKKKQDEEPPATRTKYAYEDADVRVTATLSEASAIPDEAKLRVIPVAQGGKDYDTYLAALDATYPSLPSTPHILTERSTTPTIPCFTISPSWRAARRSNLSKEPCR